jgi:TolB-like protein
MLVLICGCGSQKHYVRSEADIKNVKKVAVLPFENFTSDEYAGEKIRRILITEVLSQEVDVVEPGEITRLLRELKVKSIGSIKVAEVQEIGKTLDTNALIMGSVESFGISKGISITYPEVTINLRLIETSTGSIIWSMRHTSGGPDFWTRHLGSEGMSLSETAGKVVKEAVDKLF